MPIAPVPPPPPESYGRVLRRYDRDPRLPIRFSAYDVNVVAKPVEMHGRVAPTLFFPPGRTAGAKRATKLGWKDETEAFGAHLRGEPAPLGKRPAPPVPGAPEDTGEPRIAGAPIGAVASPDGMEPLPAGVTPIRKRAPSKARG